MTIMGNFESCYVGDCGTTITDLCHPNNTIQIEDCQAVNTELAFQLEDPASCQVLEEEVCRGLPRDWENTGATIELEYDSEGCYNLTDVENYKYYQPQLTFMKYLGIIGLGKIYEDLHYLI